MLDGINTSAERLQTSSATDRARCGTYWWYYGRMVRAGAVASDEAEPAQRRREAAEKRDENQRGIGYHLAECAQCKEWFHSFPQEGNTHEQIFD